MHRQPKTGNEPPLADRRPFPDEGRGQPYADKHHPRRLRPTSPSQLARIIKPECSFIEDAEICQPSASRPCSFSIVSTISTILSCRALTSLRNMGRYL